MPALLMSTSTPPIMRTALANADSTCCRLETSASSVPARSGSSRWMRWRAAASRSSTQTAEPSSRNRAAVAAPIPLAPPVTSTRLSSSPRMGLSSRAVRIKRANRSWLVRTCLFPDVIPGEASDLARAGTCPFPPDPSPGLDLAGFGMTSRKGRPAPLHHFSLEEVDQLDHQNDDHHQFQHEGAALVELIDHEAVELLGRMHLLRDQVFVVGHANLRSRQLVEAGGKHVAQELDGVVGVLGEFVHVEQHGVQL